MVLTNNTVWRYNLNKNKKHFKKGDIKKMNDRELNNALKTDLTCENSISIVDNQSTKKRPFYLKIWFWGVILTSAIIMITLFYMLPQITTKLTITDNNGTNKTFSIYEFNHIECKGMPTKKQLLYEEADVKLDGIVTDVCESSMGPSDDYERCIAIELNNVITVKVALNNSNILALDTYNDWQIRHLKFANYLEKIKIGQFLNVRGRIENAYSSSSIYIWPNAITFK